MKPFVRDLVWLLVSFGLWAAAFHPLDLWWLAWVAMVPAFVRLLAPEPGRRRLGLAWMAGQYWLHAALMSWTGVIAPPLAFVVPLLGLPFSWLTGFLLDRAVLRARLPLLFAGPLAIVCVEVLRDQALTGLSWASIGYSQWRWLDLIQLASIGRVHLVSLVVLVANAGIAQAIAAWRARARVGPPASAGSTRVAPDTAWAGRLKPAVLGGATAVLTPAVVAAAIVAAAWGLGHCVRPNGFAPGPLAAGLQPSIPQRERMGTQRDRFLRNLGIHRDLIARLRDAGPDLLVWSETSFCRTEEPKFTLENFLAGSWDVPGASGPSRLEARDLVLRGRDQVTILGMVRGTLLPDAERGGARDDDEDGLDETNVAWVVRGGVPTAVTYVKRGLAPFGEFNPWPRGAPGRDLVRSMIKKSAGYYPDLNPGTEPALFDCPSPSGEKKGGLTICFEVVFPWYYRESVRLGADFHVNISNDAWFDGSCELALVDVAARFRAVESGRALFRVSNSGISTLFGPDGDRLAVVEDEAGRRTQVRGVVTGRIPIGSALTPYVRWGDWPWILPVFALLSGLVAATIRSKRSLPGVSVR